MDHVCLESIIVMEDCTAGDQFIWKESQETKKDIYDLWSADLGL